MRYRQIPKRLLIDTIFIEDIEYTGVRIDHQNKLQTSVYGIEKVSTHLMFVDAKNTPKYEELKSKLIEGAKVSWNGYEKALTVKAREILKTDREHHLEVELT